MKEKHYCVICESYNRTEKAKFYDNQYYCGKHYNQLLVHGTILKRTRYDPNEFIIYNDYAEIILYDKYGNEKGRSLIDLIDLGLCIKYKWFLKDSNGKHYALTSIDRKSTRLHRLILNYDGDLDIDHINGNSLDNRRKNLRLITHQQNMMNQRTLPSNNTTGYIGITINKRNGKYNAQMKLNGKHIYLGEFNDIEDAIISRKKAELKYFGIYKSINFE